MALPVILGGLAISAGLTGAKKIYDGGKNIKEASILKEDAEVIISNAVKRFEYYSAETTKMMDRLGKKEIVILDSFNEFSDLIEKIQGRPEFKELNKSGIDLPEYEPEKLKQISAGANVLLGTLSGAATGYAGAIAASGVTTASVAALGTASTGTAISSLSGAAASNAVLAALGGGSIASGGGGIFLGTAILGGATLGVGLLIGGVIFNYTTSSIIKKSEEALENAEKTECEVDSITEYLNELYFTASAYFQVLEKVYGHYQVELNNMRTILAEKETVKWNDLMSNEKTTVQNTILLVGLLFKMCQVKLVLQSNDEYGINEVNADDIHESLSDVKKSLGDDFLNIKPSKIDTSKLKLDNDLSDEFFEHQVAKEDIIEKFHIPQHKDSNIFCERCGSYIDEKTGLCPKCGKSKNWKNNSTKQVEYKLTEKTIWIIIWLIYCFPYGLICLWNRLCEDGWFDLDENKKLNKATFNKIISNIRSSSDDTGNQPFYNKWWFWVIVALLILYIAELIFMGIIF